MSRHAAIGLATAALAFLGCSILTNLDGFAVHKGGDAGPDSSVKPVTCVESQTVQRRTLTTVSADTVQNKVYLFRSAKIGSQQRAIFEVSANNNYVHTVSFSANGGVGKASTPVQSHFVDVVRSPEGLVALALTGDALGIYTLKDNEDNWVGPISASGATDFMNANRVVGTVVPINVTTGEFIVVVSYNNGANGPLVSKAAHLKGGGAPTYAAWPVTAPNDPLGGMPSSEDMSGANTVFDGKTLTLMAFANHGNGPTANSAPNIFSVELTADPGLTKPSVQQLPLRSKDDFVVGLGLAQSVEVPGSLDLGAIALEGASTIALYGGRTSTQTLQNGNTAVQATFGQTIIKSKELPVGRSHFDVFGAGNENLLVVAPASGGGVNFVWLSAMGQLRAKQGGDTSLFKSDSVLATDVSFSEAPIVVGTANLIFAMLEPSSTKMGSYDLVAAAVACGL